MTDLTGGGDHLRAEVVYDGFAGLSRIQQHKLVYDVFEDEIGGPIHALSLKTSTPEWRASDDQRRDSRRSIKQAIERGARDAVHEGHARHAALRLLCARRRRCSNAIGADYAAMDILPDPRIRQELSELSGWPTIPQLFVDGELVGGCDIVTEMFESGELAETLGVEQPQAARRAPAPAPAQAPPLQIE